MTQPKRPLKVFLCHASTDKPKVRELYRYLKRRGINPWFDEEHLVGGQDWQVEIPKALATSDAIIICLTKNSVDKEGYIQKEIKFALDKALEMPEGRIFLIPVKFDECEVPFTLSRYQWVDLTVESGYSKMMKALKFRASQLERSIVEVSKKDVEEENLVREKKEREQIVKEAHEKQERKAPEKDTREKLQREIDKRAKDIQRELKREIFFSRFRSKLNLFFLYFRYYVLPVILILVVITGGYYWGRPFYDKAINPTEDIEFFQTSTSQPNMIITVLPSETIAPISTLTIPASLPTEITDAKDVSMVLVPAGEFTMGDDSFVYSSPAHQVYLDAFWIDQTEVTNAMYKLCVEAGHCTQPSNVSHYEDLSYVNHPVVYVSRDDAVAYCSWVERRLPTEAEWEKAARGTDARDYPWGNETPNTEFLNYSGNVGDTTPVGTYPKGASIYGALDMAGNVWEWVNDFYGDTYYQNSPSSNPQGPNSSDWRVIRGASWSDDGFSPKSWNRLNQSHKAALDDLGFRCARSDGQ